MKKEFLLSERFKLELRWKNTIYEKDGLCRFIGAYFSGPAIQIAQKINNNDNIMLDFYSQYLYLVKGAYVAKFSWGKVTYSKDGKKVYLDDAKLKHDSELNNVPQLNNSDYFVIDTSDHESSIHHYSLVYKTYLLNKDNTLYRFGK